MAADSPLPTSTRSSSTQTYAPGTARGGHDRLIAPALLARLNNLELIARAAVEGATLGLAYGLKRFKDLGMNPTEIRLIGGGSNLHPRQ